MPRSYAHIKEYGKEILELKKGLYQSAVMILAGAEGLEVASQPLLRCPKFITAWSAYEF